MGHSEHFLKTLILTWSLFLSCFIAVAEGTKEFRPQESHKGELCIDTTRNKFCSVSATEDYRLHIHISDFANEAIYFGFGQTKHNQGATTFRLYRPDHTIDTSGAVPTTAGSRGYIETYGQAVAGPTITSPGTGYWALRCTPDMNGDYYLGLKITWATGFVDSYKTYENFDITVINTLTMQPIPGRVWSKAWQLYSETPQNGSNNRYWGRMFVYSADSIVTKVDLNGMIPGTFTISCNHSGCQQSPPAVPEIARKSVNGESTFPEYKIFLNDPDELAYPSGVLGGLDNTVPITAERDCDGTIDFTFGCTKAGNVELKLDLSVIGPGFVDRFLPQQVNSGLNTVFWDGNDGSIPPKPVPNGSMFNLVISYVNGLTHLPLYDVEFNNNGFFLDLVRPITVPPPPSPLFYWDDSNFSGGSTNFTGCLPAPPSTGCHAWSTPPSGGFGNNRTLNTWWYAVSTDSDPVQITEKRFPSDLGVISGSTQLCQGSQYSFSVDEDENSTRYVWVYPGGTDTTNNPSVLVTIPGSAPPGPGIITVHGINESCGTGPLSTLNITINPFPTITITGETSVCDGANNVIYITESGQSNYLWNFSPGATLVAGGGLSHSFITVNWNGIGPQTVSVNYTNPISTCTGAAPHVLNITVHPHPVPEVTGPAEVCALETGIVYATAPNKLNYTWSVSAGGAITSGGTSSDHTVTVLWGTAGPQHVSVGFTDESTNCTSLTPTVYNVLVKPLPEPTVSGDATPCNGSTGNIYSSQPGQTDYSWTISPGGVITAGGTASDPTVTITWNATGNQSVSINYINSTTQCTALNPVSFPVVVQPLPDITIAGPASVCVNNAGPVYTTQAGHFGYSWNIIPAGAGIITGGSGTESVSVTWTTTGVHQISVNYTDAFTGCRAAAPASYQVTVNTLPVPVLSGDAIPCTGLPKTYTTDPGASAYTWIVSSGGTIVSGGGNTDPTVTIVWNNPGSQTVSVNYTIGTGCSGAAPTQFNVTVHQSTLPVITGPDAICETGTATYQTQAGNTAYVWNISPGGTFTSGTTGNLVNVRWNSSGPGFISANFTNEHGCTAPSPTTFAVTVNPLPVTTITRITDPLCSANSGQFQVPSDAASTFSWSINPAGAGIIASGQGTHLISINWSTSGNAIIDVTGNKTLTGCTSGSTLPVVVNPSPNPQFTACFDTKTTPQAKRFTLRGANPFVTGSGVFSGNRVSLNAATGEYEFDPFGAPTGTYPVFYTYKNVFQCEATTPAVTITVSNPAFSCNGILTDVRDGKSYTTSLIGGRCWMKQNLNYGIKLEPETQSQTDNCTAEKYCLPADPNCTLFGGLYQWEELMAYGTTSQNQGLCPPGWHIPSESEWQDMINAITTGIAPPSDGLAGGFLKDTTIVTGFHARVRGFYYLNTTWGFLSGTPTGTMFWTSTPVAENRAIARGSNTTNPSASKYPGSRGNAFSVRCVRD